MATKSINESCNRRTAFGELKAMLHKLTTGEIRIAAFNLSALMGSASNGRPISSRVESALGGAS